MIAGEAGLPQSASTAFSAKFTHIVRGSIVKALPKLQFHNDFLKSCYYFISWGFRTIDLNGVWVIRRFMNPEDITSHCFAHSRKLNRFRGKLAWVYKSKARAGHSVNTWEGTQGEPVKTRALLGPVDDFFFSFTL